MYLSRVEIDLKNRRKIKDLVSLEEYHAWVESCFPNEISKKIRTRKLWRIDKLSGKTYLLILSENKPDLKIIEKYGVVGSAESKNYDSYLNSLENGMKLAFRVRLNPTKSLLENHSKERGRLVPLLNDEAQIKYLVDRSEKNGFELDMENLKIVDKGFKNYIKNDNKKLRLISATFEGKLTITNLETFLNILKYGFGKKKAYGFGLMTVIKINDWKKWS